jgi:hypothetical protein
MAFPGLYNFNYYIGDTYKFTIYPKDADGNTFSLNSFTGALFTIANKRGSTGTQISATAEIDTTTDTVLCTITPSQGRSLNSTTTYVYDVQITDGSNIYTLLTGSITPTDDISGAI